LFRLEELLDSAVKNNRNIEWDANSFETIFLSMLEN